MLRSCRPPARRSPRGGGCTFAEDPGRSASTARLLWTRAADPSVLIAALPACRSGQGASGGLRPDFEVAGDGVRAALFGTPLSGVRVDVRPGMSARRGMLRAEFALGGALPLQLAELGRLWRICADGMPPDPAQRRDDARTILILRTIDALAEGASLRAIGAALVQSGAWPGEGEWAKSRARRLVAAAHALWAGGPLGPLRFRSVNYSDGMRDGDRPNS